MLRNAARIWLTIVIVAFTSTSSHSVERNRECGNHDRVVAFLASKYKEQQRAIGLVTKGNVSGVIELYVSEKTGTWTVLMTHTNGVSCIIASGESFEQAKGLPKDPNA